MEVNYRHQLKPERPVFAKRMEARRKLEADRLREVARMAQWLFDSGFAVPLNFLDEMRRPDGVIKLEPKK